MLTVSNGQDLMIYADSVEKKLQQENAELRRQLQEVKFDLEDATNSRRELQQRLIISESRNGLEVQDEPVDSQVLRLATHRCLGVLK